VIIEFSSPKADTLVEILKRLDWGDLKLTLAEELLGIARNDLSVPSMVYHDNAIPNFLFRVEEDCSQGVSFALDPLVGTIAIAGSFERSKSGRLFPLIRKRQDLEMALRYCSFREIQTLTLYGTKISQRDFTFLLDKLGFERADAIHLKSARKLGEHLGCKVEVRP